jgi:hypothetical protein
MYWKWEDPAGKIKFSLKSRFFEWDSLSYRRLRLENNSEQAISSFVIHVDKLNWRGKAIDKGIVYFHDVSNGKSAKDTTYVSRRYKITDGEIRFDDGKSVPIDVSQIKIGHAWWEPFRITQLRVTGPILALQLFVFVAPRLRQEDLMPDVTPADKIAHCMAERSGARPLVNVQDEWVWARYDFEKKFSPTSTNYYEVGVLTQKAGYMPDVRTGENYPDPMWMFGAEPYDTNEKVWSDPGVQEPQRTAIQDLKICTSQVMPERAFALK